MAYTITFKNAALDPLKATFTVPDGTVDSTHTSLALTGKGAANFGELQQTNFVRLVENFADAVAPAHPTIGQHWYDSAEGVVKVCVDTTPSVVWKTQEGIQVQAGLPAATPGLGDFWFDLTGTASGILYVYTGLGRYPSNGSAVGGWEQVWPAPQVVAGRAEYDEMYALVDELVGPATSTHGSSAKGRAPFATPTNFSAMDLDLRTKYAALGADANVLVSTATDGAFSEQAASMTMFYVLDSASPSDGYICGAVGSIPTIGSAPTIHLNGAPVALPATSLGHDLQVDEGFILYDTNSAANVLPPAVGVQGPYTLVRLNNGVWEFDRQNLADWQTFTPTATMYLVGKIRTLQNDNNTVYPIDLSSTCWAHAVPMVGIKDEHLKVEPNSQDWDTLLTAAKYALNRLELPPMYHKQISSIPFVQDGRAPVGDTLLLTPADASYSVLYPSADRRSGRRLGIATQVQAYSETLNALGIAIQNRFSLKGINGATGTNPTFGSNIAAAVHGSAPFVNSSIINIGSKSVRMRFRFTSIWHRESFLGSGGAIEVWMSANASDVNLQSLFAQRGCVRLTADKTRVYNTGLSSSSALGSRTLVASPIQMGLWNSNSTGVQMTQQSVGPSTYMVTAFRGAGEDSFDVDVTFNAGVAIPAAGVSVQFNVIYDNELGGTVYTRPLSYIAGDLITAL